MKSKLIILGTIFLTLCVTSCDFNLVEGNEVPVSREFKITDYSEIDVAGGPEKIIYENKDGSPYLRIELDSNLFQHIKAEVIDNKLSIGTEKNINISPSKYIVYTNSKELNKINLAGSSEIELVGELNSKDLEISISGSGDIKAENIKSENLNLYIAGSGSAIFKGTASKCKIDISGSGNIEAKELIIKNLDGIIAGSGSIIANVTESINGQISGSGNISYSGSPSVVNSSISGSGEVTKYEE